MSEFSTHTEMVSGKSHIKVEDDLEGSSDEKLLNSTAALVDVKNEFVPEEFKDIGKQNDFFNITQRRTGAIHIGEVDSGPNDVASARECKTHNLNGSSSAEWEAVLIKEENIEDTEEITQTLVDRYSPTPFESVENSQQYGKLFQFTVIREKYGKNCGNGLKSEVCVFPFRSEADEADRNSGKKKTQTSLNNFSAISFKNKKKVTQASVGNSPVSFETLKHLQRDDKSVQVAIKQEEASINSGNECDQASVCSSSAVSSETLKHMQRDDKSAQIAIKQEEAGMNSRNEHDQASVCSSSAVSSETLKHLQRDDKSVQIAIKQEEAGMNSGNERDPEASVHQSYLETAYTRVQTLSCDYCFAEFRRSSEMESHMPIHIGEQLSSGAPNFVAVKTEGDGQRSDPLREEEITQLSIDRHSTAVTNQEEVAAASTGSFSAVSFENQDLKRDISQVKLGETDQNSRNELDARWLVFSSHLESADTKVQFPCKRCVAGFGTRVELERHVLACIGEQLSSSMPATLKTSSDIKRGSHCVKRHSCNVERRPCDVARFSCEKCGKVFTTKEHLKRHLVIHSGHRAFACTQCPTAFKTSHHLAQHLRVHSNVRNFACEQCAATFKSKQCLQRHLQKHSSVKLFQCPKCANAFHYMSSMKRHFRVHSNGTVSHAQCPAEFKSKYGFKLPLVQHSQDKRSMQSAELLSTTLPKKQLLCAHCNTSFNSRKCLIRHLTVHFDERPFSCPVCFRRFKTKPDLKEHAFIHSEVKRYSCVQCTAAFHSRSSMIRHLAVHSDKKPFICAECPAAFKTKCEVTLHSAVHSAKRQFSCAFCTASFTYQSNLYRHLAVHSNKEPLFSYAPFSTMHG